MMLDRFRTIFSCSNLKKNQGPLVQAILNSFDEISAERAAGRQIKTEETYNQSIAMDICIVVDGWTNRQTNRWMDGVITLYLIYI